MTIVQYASLVKTLAVVIVMAAVAFVTRLRGLTDDVVTTYVSDLGQVLAERSGRSHLAYTFKVVNSAEINAFALPGGFIYVNRGLSEAAQTETELAGVLGHEIGHVVARHGAEQAQRASIANLGLSCSTTRAAVGACSARFLGAGRGPRSEVWRLSW